MAKLLKLRRGTTSQHSSFTGAEGEVTVDTDKETLVVHNGSTAGGFPLLRASGGSEAISTTGQITSGNITVSSNAPKIDFVDGNNNPDFRIDCNSGAMTIIDTTNSANRLIIQSDGTVDVQGNLDANSGLDVTGDITASGTLTAGTSTINGNITLENDVPKITFNDNNSENDFSISNTNGTFTLHDNDANATRMSCTSTGQFTFATNVDFSGGIDVTGELTGDRAVFADDGSSSPTVLIKTDDQSPWALAVRNDTYWNHDSGGWKLYQDNTGNIDQRVMGNGAFLNWYFNTQNGGTTDTVIHIDTNRAVNLRYQGSPKLSTTNTGVDVTGNIVVSGTVDGVDIAALNTTVGNISTEVVNDTSPQLGGALDGQNNNVTGLGNVEAKRIVLLDDGASSPTLQVRTDDQSPWAVQIRNDTYWNSDSNGFKAYQDNSGNFRCNWEGNGAFINTYFQQTNGGTTSNTIHFDTNRACHIAYQGAVKFATTSNGVDFGVAGSNDILCISGQSLHRTGSNGAGLHFTSSAVFPTDSDGNSVNGSIDFGSSTKRWNNIFTSDLDLSNEAKGVNDIDGTWGHYTIVEGESDLFLKNNRSGKTYKFNLTEIS